MSGRSRNSEKFDLWFKSDPTTLFVTSTVLAITLFLIVRSLRSKDEGEPVKAQNATKKLPNPLETLNLIQSRRSLFPKDYLNVSEGGAITEIELQMLLEASNWAPTHGKTEPWRYVVISSADRIMEYLDFLENWYEERSHELTEESVSKFRKKLANVRSEWPVKVSHLIVVVMKRKALKDKIMPEWEELAAVAMSVQNVHLMATSLNLGLFWSSHTWCKDARESVEMKAYLNFEEEDKILGALTLGRYDSKRRFTSTRGDVRKKVEYRE